mmetsp:Transcript_15763/g.31412  ORF Transcript_15763/g.31412 Transcript_15763/m.31412 type:complete len:220 (-) Transcript_15763:392-1051(-)
MITRRGKSKSLGLIHSGLKYSDGLPTSKIMDPKYLKSRKSSRNMKRRRTAESPELSPSMNSFPSRPTVPILSSEIEAMLSFHLLPERVLSVCEQNPTNSQGLRRPCTIFGGAPLCLPSLGQGSRRRGTHNNYFSPNLFPFNTHRMNLSVLNQVAANMNRLLDFSLAKGLDLLPVIALQTGVPKYCIENFLDGDTHNFFSERVLKKTEKALRAWMKEHGR